MIATGAKWNLRYGQWPFLWFLKVFIRKNCQYGPNRLVLPFNVILKNTTKMAQEPHVVLLLVPNYIIYKSIIFINNHKVK